VNAETGEPICDAVVMAVASDGRDGARTYTLVPPSAGSCRQIGVYRPGTYVVQATRAGFSPGAVAGIRVEGEDEPCPWLQPVDVVVRMQPER
jgi:hypothetical protein